MQEKELIYKMLEEGKISREEADELLEALRKSYGYKSENPGLPENEALKAESTVIQRRVKETEGSEEGPEKERETDSADGEFNILENLSNLFSNLLGPKQSLYKEYTGVFNASEPVVEIENTNGQTEVIGWDEDFFKLRLEFKTNARSIEEAEKARDRSLKFSCSEERLRLKVVSKSFFKITANIKLYLPIGRNYYLSLESTNGKTVLKGLEFKKGRIKLTNGKLRIKDVAGDSMGLEVANGMIDFKGRASSLNARVNNGNMTVTPVVRGSSNLEMRTTNGNLKVVLSEESACYFEGKTTNGVVSTELSGMETIRSESKIMKKHLVARTADWEESSNRIKIEARTTNGNVKLERG